MKERVRVTIDFELPQNATGTECAGLVFHQMRSKPEWKDRAGTGCLNYVCYDQTMRIVAMDIYTP